MEYPIPTKSTEAFEWLIDDKKKTEEQKKRKLFRNPGLIFDRFSPGISKGDDNTKHEALVVVRDSAALTEKELLNAWNTRWEKLVHTVEAKPFTLKTDWRLIAGLGKKGSLEVGFTFHRYGFPYLPGSSLKGLARAYGLLEIASLLGKEKLEALRKRVAERTHKKLDEIGLLSALDSTLSIEDEDKKLFSAEFDACKPTADMLEMANAFRQIFGTTETAGKAIFFDAIPSAKFPPRIELEIMNPHYPDYYREMGSKNPTVYPTNWQSPNPVQFLTVAPNSVFFFAIGWRDSPEDGKDHSEKKQQPHTWSWFKGEQIDQKANEASPRLIKLARRWLQGGLLELGAGGKTSAGYGYFEKTSKE